MSFVSRNNDPNCRTREKEGGGHLSIGTMILTVEPGRRGIGYLSLGTMILGVERGGGGGVTCLFLSVEPGRQGSFVSRNNDSKCRTSHLSLGINILSVESER